MASEHIARLADDAVIQSIEDVFDPKTGQYYRPYNPIEEELARHHSAGFTGEGITIAVLDTGVLSHHPGLRGRIAGSVDFTGEGPEDLNGHGTMVALLAAGPLKPGPAILNVKVVNKHGTGREEDIAAGMRWAADHGADLLNMSLGIPRSCDGTCLLCSTATEVHRSGVRVAAAAGNWGPGVRSCPAQCDSVTAVGALDYAGENIADYSGQGDGYMAGSFDLVRIDEDGTFRPRQGN